MRRQFTACITFLLIVLSFVLILVNCPFPASLAGVARLRFHSITSVSNTQLASLAKSKFAALIPNLTMCSTELPAAFMGNYSSVSTALCVCLYCLFPLFNESHRLLFSGPRLKAFRSQVNFRATTTTVGLTCALHTIVRSSFCLRRQCSHTRTVRHSNPP